MHGNFTSLLVVGALGLAGCGVGGGGGGGGTTDAAQNPPPADTRTNDDAIKCTAQIALAGTFTAPAQIDPAGGCQPTGTWAVTATVSDKGTCTDVPIKATYNYTFTPGPTGMGRDSKITYAGAGTGEEFQGAVSASGDGACTGSFEHILPDSGNFDQITLRPTLPKPDATVMTTLTIGGTGEFDLWNRHP